MPSIASKVLDIAAKEVGVKEQGSNRGPRIEEYLRAIDLALGNPYCAALVAWCFKQAGIPDWPKTGYCPTLETWAKSHECLVPTPVAGDVFLLYDWQGPYHTGFVELLGTPGTGQIYTIEGNTTLPSGGEGVARKIRQISECKFIHWQSILEVPEPPPVDYYKIFWHDGKGKMILPNGEVHIVKGVKIDGKPWAGGEILIGV